MENGALSKVIYDRAGCVLNNLSSCNSHYHILLLFPGLSIDDFSRKKMDATATELTEEKALAYSCLN